MMNEEHVPVSSPYGTRHRRAQCCACANHAPMDMPQFICK